MRVSTPGVYVGWGRVSRGVLRLLLASHSGDGNNQVGARGG